MKKRIIAFVIDIIILGAVLFLSMISPYRYEWDESLRQTDSDAADALIILWVCLGVFALCSTLLKNKADLHVVDHEKRKIVSSVFGGAAALYCVINIARLIALS